MWSGWKKSHHKQQARFLGSKGTPHCFSPSQSVSWMLFKADKCWALPVLCPPRRQRVAGGRGRLSQISLGILSWLTLLSLFGLNPWVSTWRSTPGASCISLQQVLMLTREKCKRVTCECEDVCYLSKSIRNRKWCELWLQLPWGNFSQQFAANWLLCGKVCSVALFSSLLFSSLLFSSLLFSSLLFSSLLFSSLLFSSLLFSSLLFSSQIIPFLAYILWRAHTGNSLLRHFCWEFQWHK